MPITLNDWQDEAYQDTVDIWRRIRNAAGDLVWGTAAYATAIPCLLHSTENLDMPVDHMGLVKMANIFTLDKMDCHADVDVMGEDYIQVKSTGNRAYQGWYAVKGDGKVRDAKGDIDSDYQKVYLNLGTDPPDA